MNTLQYISLYNYSQDLTRDIFQAIKKYGVYSPQHLVLLGTRQKVWELLDELSA